MSKNIIFNLKDKNAIIPSKAYDGDIGFDIYAIKENKRIKETIFYDTGVSVTPPKGFYFKLYPRSSITKTGYILGNSVGIIDPTYTGTIIIPLLKIDPEAKKLEFPFKICQLVLTKIYDTEISIEITRFKENFDEMNPRRDKGFGSSG